MRSSGKFDGIETLPLFKMAKAKANRGESAKRVAVAGWVTCPRCRPNDRTAVIRDGAHLVYRQHTYQTWSGNKIECQASHQRLCTLPPKPWLGTNPHPPTERCTCQH